MTFGDKLQALRKQQKISQDNLAEQLGVSRMTISRWESGQSLPDINQILKISEVFTVSVDYLMYENIDETDTGQLKDFQSLRVLFWICNAIHLVGVFVAMIGWLWLHMAFLVVLGFFMNLLACVFFEVLPPKGIDRMMVRYARKRFYAVGIWMFLPVPIFAFIEIANSIDHFTSMLPYIIGGAVYLITAAIITICLMRQYRK